MAVFSFYSTANENNLPILLAGKAGGQLQAGQHIASPKNTPLCNLYQTMLGAMGVETEAFGDSNGLLEDMLVSSRYKDYNPVC